MTQAINSSAEPAPAQTIRAAQYVRMSTEHQKYSTENQAEIIARYAAQRGFEIVETYADNGKSGLRLDGRDALPTASATAEEIRARILAETGLTASAGVSYNKFLAKLASDQRKPNGQFVVPPERGEAFVEALPVKRFHGVGPVTAEKMNRLGIETGADLKRQSLAFLQHHFGKSGAWYHGVARGEDLRPVNPDRERKSSGSETTFASDLVDPAAIEAGLDEMADDVWAWCEKAGSLGRTVTVKVKWADFQQSTRSRSFNEPVASKARLREIARLLVRSLYPPTRGVRLVGVTLSNLEKASPGTPSRASLGELAL